MPVSPIDPNTGAPGGTTDWAKLLGPKRAAGPITKNGKVVSAEAGFDPAAIGSLLEMMRSGADRQIQPMEMPSMSITPDEFKRGSAETQARMVKKYGADQILRGKGAGNIAPGNDPIGGGYSAGYNPGEPGFEYSGGPKTTATSGGVQQMSGGYAPQDDRNLQSALATASLGGDSPQAPPDVFRAIKRRRIMNQLDDPGIAQLASQYGIIPGDEMLRGIRGY